MSSIVGPVTDAVINNIIKELKKKETKEKIMKNIIDPFLCDLSSRYFPYLLTIIITLLLIVILLVALLIMNMINSKNNT